MISKLCMEFFLINLIFISSCFSKSLESKEPSVITTKETNTSTPNSILSVPGISDQISKWSNLVTQLKRKKEEGEGIVRLGSLLTLTYKIHNFSAENKQILESDEQLKKKFSSLKNDIPESVRNIIWGSKCAIRNAQDFENYLNIIQPSEKSEVKTLELGNTTKTYWKFIPYLESGSEEKLTFLILDFANSDNLLGLKYVDRPIFGGWAQDGGILEIVPARLAGLEKMVNWTIEPFISDGGSTKGEVINYMSTEYRHPVKPSRFYFHESLQAASIIRSAWEFDCI